MKLIIILSLFAFTASAQDTLVVKTIQIEKWQDDKMREYDTQEQQLRAQIQQLEEKKNLVWRSMLQVGGIREEDVVEFVKYTNGDKDKKAEVQVKVKKRKP